MKFQLTKGLSRKASTHLQAYLLIAPMVIGVTLFAIYPAIYALVNSFFNISYYTETTFEGFKYYRHVLAEKEFYKSLWNGVRYILYVVPANFVISFLVANVIYYLPKKLGGVMKTSIYIPGVVSGVVTSLLFTFIYNYQNGVLNKLVVLFGGTRIAWTNNVNYSMLAIAIPAIWMGFGGTTLYMLAGLNDVPTSFYEAAELDGANWLKKMIHITLPCMRNVFIYLGVTAIVGGMQVFDLPQLITGGGPLYSSLTPNLYIYNKFTYYVEMGYSIAGAIMLFILLSGLSVLIFKIVNSEKSMD